MDEFSAVFLEPVCPGLPFPFEVASVYVEDVFEDAALGVDDLLGALDDVFDVVLDFLREVADVAIVALE